MRGHKIYTRDESMRGPAKMLAVAAVFYCFLGAALFPLTDKFLALYIFLMLIGAFPFALGAVQIRRIRKVRSRHERCVREQEPLTGWITGCSRVWRRTYIGRHASHYYDYYLDVEVRDGQSGAVRQISCGPYEKPVSCLLSSPEVEVYCLEEGKGSFFLAGFHLKRSGDEPDIPIHYDFDMSFEAGRRAFAMVVLGFFFACLFGMVRGCF